MVQKILYRGNALENVGVIRACRFWLMWEAVEGRSGSLGVLKLEWGGSVKGLAYLIPRQVSVPLFYFYFLMEFNESCSFGKSVLEHPRRGMSGGGDYKARIFSVSVIVVIMIRFSLSSFFFLFILFFFGRRSRPVTLSHRPM